MRGSPLIVGIGGGTGAGKTTFAKDIDDLIGAPSSLISLDNYYRDRSHLSPEERRDVNFDHPDAIEWDIFVDDLKCLANGTSVELPQYDFETHTRSPSVKSVKPGHVVIIEGIFTLFTEEVRDLIDIPVYVQTDPDVRVLRRLRRDVVDRGRDIDGVVDQYLETVKPMHEKYVEPTKQHADIIVPEGTNETAVELMCERITSQKQEI